MSAFVNSLNMMLPVPIVGVTIGPEYAIDLNNCFALIDSHDHTPGNGVAITTEALNINADLAMNGYVLNTIGALTLSTQVLAPDPGSVYMSGVDLFYIDALGNEIQITQDGGVAGTPGSIANLTPPASAAYVSGSSTFVWESNTSIAANMDFGAAIMRNLSPNSTFALTLQPPTLVSNYSIILPSLPSANNTFVTMSTAGVQSATVTVDNASLEIASSLIQIKALGVLTSMINTEAVTEPKLADDSVSTRTIIDGDVTKVKLNDDVRLEAEEFILVVPSFTVRVATTVNGTFATAFDNGSTIDGVVLATNDLILIKNQTAAADNGVYVVQASGNPVRSTSYDTAAEINFAAVNVTLGTTNAGTKWFQNNFIVTLGTDVQSWSLSSTEAFVVPTGVTVINILMVGGGGGGGGERTSGLANNGYGAGGGAGSLPQSAQLIVVPGETLSIQIGNGGAGGPQNTSTNGGTGGISAIKRGNTSLMSVTGATGGNTNGSAVIGAAIATAINIIGTIVGSGAGSTNQTGQTAGSGSNTFYALGGAGGTAGTGGGPAGGGGGGGGAGLEAGGAGGVGAPNSSSATGGAGSPGFKGSGGGGGAGSSAGQGGAGGRGGDGYILISYF